MEKMFLEISQGSQKNTRIRVSFLIKLRNFIEKETLAQVFSCEFYNLSKNIFFYRTPLVAASEKLTLSKLRFSGFKKFVVRSVLGSFNSGKYHLILKLLVAT